MVSLALHALDFAPGPTERMDVPGDAAGLLHGPSLSPATRTPNTRTVALTRSLSSIPGARRAARARLSKGERKVGIAHPMR